jgi:P27 family predicted phage terminase small subunit
MPGPTKTPVSVKLLRGTYRADRDGRRPSPRAEPPVNLTAPDWFNEAQRESWDYVVSSMPLGALRLIDRGILQVFCVAEAAYTEAVQKVIQYGMVIKHDGQPVISPYQRIVDRQAAVLLRAGEMLGAGRGSAGPGGNAFANNGKRPHAAA